MNLFDGTSDGMSEIFKIKYLYITIVFEYYSVVPIATKHHSSKLWSNSTT